MTTNIPQNQQINTSDNKMNFVPWIGQNIKEAKFL